MDITPGTGMVNSIPSTSEQHPAHPHHFHLTRGIHFRFPTFKHDHPPVVNVNEEFTEQLTTGQKVADKVAAAMGSWRFVITQATIMIVWVTFNTVAWFFHFDGYPYILLNLAMSAQAAFATPLIMMSQNRQAEKDRLTAQNDYQTDCKGEEEIRHIMEHLDHQDTVILQMLQHMEAHHNQMMEHLSRLDPEMARRLGADLQQIEKEIAEEEAADGNISGNS